MGIEKERIGPTIMCPGQRCNLLGATTKPRKEEDTAYDPRLASSRKPCLRGPASWLPPLHLVRVACSTAVFTNSCEASVCERTRRERALPCMPLPSSPAHGSNSSRLRCRHAGAVARGSVCAHICTVPCRSRRVPVPIGCRRAARPAAPHRRCPNYVLSVPTPPTTNPRNAFTKTAVQAGMYGGPPGPRGRPAKRGFAAARDCTSVCSNWPLLHLLYIGCV
jgi:hypothetical protein